MVINLKFFFLSFLVALTFGQTAGDCTEDQICLHINKCPDLRNLARRVKNSNDPAKKIEIFAKIKSRVCGPKKSFKVCCDASNVENIETENVEIEIVDEAPPAVIDLKQDPCKDFSSIGSFNQLTFHPLSGKVVVVDESTLVICNFVYDGLGPDAFFVVGDKTAASRPSPKDNKPVVPVDVSGKRNFQFRDTDIPILREYKGEKVEIKLPQGVAASSLKWIAVFCRDFNINFGQVNFN